MTYEEDVQYALDYLQKEKAVKRKAVRKEKVARIKGKAISTTKRIVKKVDVTKPGEGYKTARKLGAVVMKQVGKKPNTSELKSARAHELKMAKLRHKQKLAQMAMQADQMANQQDPRYSQDYMEDQFLGETAPEQPREEEYYGQNVPQQSESRRMSFLNNLKLRGNKSRLHFESNRLNPRNLLNFENKINTPDNPYSNHRLSLMQGTPQAERLRFTTAPSVIRTSGNSPPTKISFLKTNKPTKMTVFGKTKL